MMDNIIDPLCPVAQHAVGKYGTIPEINQITISELPDSNHSLDTLEDTTDGKSSGSRY